VLFYGGGNHSGLRGFELMAIGRCYTSYSSLAVFSTWAHTRHAAQDGRAIEWPIECAAYSRRGLPRRISQYLCGRAARSRPGPKPSQHPMTGCSAGDSWKGPAHKGLCGRGERHQTTQWQCLNEQRAHFGPHRQR
jgi:hypothetical protein